MVSVQKKILKESNQQKKVNLLESKAGTRFIVFAFYFAEGIPIGFIWWAMPTLLNQNGVEVDVIGSFTALLTLPWILKFLWAPLIDILRTPNFGFKKWIGVSQLAMCLTLIPLLFIPISGNILWWGMFLFLHSLAAATQDVSVDAMIINTTKENEHGALNGYMQAGMLVARSIFGGGALILLAKTNVSLTIGLMIASTLCTIFLLRFISVNESREKENNQILQFKNSLLSTFKTKQIWHILGFALTAAAAFEVVGAFVGPFLKSKAINMEQIGYFFGLPVVISMLLGGLTGGYLSDYIERKKAVFIFLLGVVFLVTIISGIGFLNSEAPIYVLLTLLSIMYFFTGMFTASSYALFMDLTNPKIAATQFSTFMAATNACEAWVVWISGLVVVSYNYSFAFLLMCLVSLASLFLLKRIKNEE